MGRRGEGVLRRVGLGRERSLREAPDPGGRIFAASAPSK